MVGWIVLGMVLLGLLVLAVAMLSVLRRLGALRHAMIRARRLGIDAQTLQSALIGLQDRVTSVRNNAMSVQNRLTESRKPTAEQ